MFGMHNGCVVVDYSGHYPHVVMHSFWAELMMEHKELPGCTSLSGSKEQIILVILSFKQERITGLVTQFFVSK